MNTTFDSSADWYSHYYLNRDSRKSVKEIVKILKPMINKQIIDLGCGTGEITNEFSNLGFQLKGIDPSPRMIEVAKKRFGTSKINWEVGDLSSISEESIMYGYAYFHVVNYILAEMNIFEFLSVLKTKTKIGGKFIFDFWKGESVSAGGLESRSVKFDINGVSHTRTVTPILNNLGNITIEIKISPNVLNPINVVTHEEHKLGTFVLSELKSACDMLNLKYSIHTWEDKHLSNDVWDAVCLIERIA
jgi:SAM-dependent methyltransferase